MNIFEFIIMALAIVIIGIPALFCLLCVALAWIDARDAGRRVSQYPPAVEEPEDEI